MGAHRIRSRTVHVLMAGCAGALVGLASACGGEATTGTANVAVQDGGSSGGASNGGASSGGASSGGATNNAGRGSNAGGTVQGQSGGGGVAQGGRGTAGRPGTGGTTDCPPECFVANECVEVCGDAPQNFGCCPCPSGMINVFSCPASDAGSASSGSCDPRRVLCRSLPPTCPAGQVPSVDGSCWGPCVAISTCTCNSADDCPEPNQYTCHLSRGVCDYYVN